MWKSLRETGRWNTIPVTRIRLPPTPRRVAFRCLGGLAAASVCCLAGCNPSDRPTAPSGSLLVTALTVNGPASILVGQSARFTATARFGNGATQDVTTSAAWYSSSPQVATVSGAGLVSASGLGTTAIAASYGMVSATVAVSVVGPGGRLTGRVVNALAPEAGLQDAIVDVDGVGWTISDSNGYFTLASTEQRKYAVRVTSPSWVDRQTWMKVPGAHLDVSLIPGSFDLQFFNQMCRGFGGRLLRWTQVPVLVVETSILEYAGKRATDEQVPVPLLDQTVEKLRRALSDQSAGRFPDFWLVERRTTPGGGTSGIPHGAIALTWQRGLVAGFGHVAYGSRSTGGTSDLVNGEVALDADWHIHHLPKGSRTDYDLVVKHEFGHALGYSHTAIPPSFMFQVYLMDVSSKDREAFKIFFQRPSGNQAPDFDPSGVSLNVTSHDSLRVPIW